MYAARTPFVAAQARRVGGWFLIGATASVLELGLLRVLYEVLAWPWPVASLVAAEVLILVKFLTTDHWVFHHPRPAINRLARYQGASIGALIVYWLAFNALVELLGVPYVVAFVLGTGAAFGWSLVTNFLWVWAQPTRDTTETAP
jgi:putative flippase GtrA